MADASSNTPTMAEPSDDTGKRKIDEDSEITDRKKQKMSTAFSLELRPATIIRQAFAALSDPPFNSELSGFLEVGGKAFKITVHRTVETVSGSEQSVYGFLHLIPENLMSFTCTYPLKKLVRLDIVSDVLSKARDDDIVHVYAEYESSNLFFEFSRNPDEHVTPDTIIMPGILVEEMTPQCRSLPDISYGLHTLLPHSYISQLTSDMLREPSTTRSPDVTMNIQSTSMSMEVSDLEFRTPEQNLEVSFRWTFWESLRQATLLENACFLLLVTDPSNSIMLNFKLIEFGDSGYLIDANFNFEEKLNAIGTYSSAT